MAANFRISIHQNSESLHIKLVGDFDGSSAHELLDALQKNCRKASKIFIHTSSLKEIHPFGREVFQSNMCQIGQQVVPLVFTGEKAVLLAPERNHWSPMVSYLL